MRNLRCVVEWEGVGSVELDRITLPDGSFHYEVEIEDPREEEHRALVKKVKSLAPSARFSGVGKFSRFMSGQGLP